MRGLVLRRPAAGLRHLRWLRHARRRRSWHAGRQRRRPRCSRFTVAEGVRRPLRRRRRGGGAWCLVALRKLWRAASEHAGLWTAASKHAGTRTWLGSASADDWGAAIVGHRLLQLLALGNLRGEPRVHERVNNSAKASRGSVDVLLVQRELLRGQNAASKMTSARRWVLSTTHMRSSS